ncbi:zinc finger, CCHC-type containing protein [Tanacetum coccineum]|uniref:Zinc finger, CCHC-type containing protein n=1 Tax=Tanacetum coccineum TaxID=301880 RepID=A0ABQ5HPJ6_9ASTR
MHFLFSTISVVYVLTTPMPGDGENATVKQMWKRINWENDDYMCRDIILDGPVIEQYNELIGLLDRFTQHKMNMDEAIQDGDKPKGNNVAGPSVVNMVEHNNSNRKPRHLKNDCKGRKVGNKANVYYVTNISEAYFAQDDDVAWLNIVNDNIDSAFMSTSKLNDSILRHARLNHVYYKRMQAISKDGLISAFDMDTKKWQLFRLLDPKLQILGERGIECIFVGYVEHSKDFKFYVIKPNESILINSIIKSNDDIFDENRFSSIPRPSQRSLLNGTEDRWWTPKNFGHEFQLYLSEGTIDEVSNPHSYCFIIEDEPKIFDKAMKSQDAAFWKEEINDDIDFIIGNNTWVLVDLPPGPLGYKWILKRKLKVGGNIEKARLVIQSFRQKLEIDYFDTYALVARISAIRLLIDLTSIHNLIIHQMDVKTAFLNGKLDEEVYMIQPQGFIIPDNENKVLHERHGEADVILGIRIKRESNGIAISRSHYIEKVLKKFNYFDCTQVSTPVDTSEKLMPNNGQGVS